MPPTGLPNLLPKGPEGGGLGQGLALIFIPAGGDPWTPWTPPPLPWTPSPPAQASPWGWGSMEHAMNDRPPPRCADSRGTAFACSEFWCPGHKRAGVWGAADRAMSEGWGRDASEGEGSRAGGGPEGG